MEQTTETKKPVKISLSLILGWGLGILFILTGITALISTPLAGIFYLLAGLVVFPPFLEFFKKKRNIELSKAVKIVSFLVLLVLAGTFSAQKEQTNSIKSSSVSPTQEQAKVQQNKPTPTAVPAVPTIAFNTHRGNNSVAAAQAQRIQDSFDSATPGLVKDVYIELDPQSLGGKSEAEYEKSILQGAQINIIVDGDSWDNTSDSVKKDFVAGLITVIQGNIGVYPSVLVNNGIRNVAEGSWSIWNGQASVTLE